MECRRYRSSQQYFDVIACTVMFVCKNVKTYVKEFVPICLCVKNIRIRMFLRICAYITVYDVEDKPCLYGGVVYGATGGHLGVRVAMTVAYFAKLYFQYSMYVCSVCL